MKGVNLSNARSSELLAKRVSQRVSRIREIVVLGQKKPFHRMSVLTRRKPMEHHSQKFPAAEVLVARAYEGRMPIWLLFIWGALAVWLLSWLIF